MMGSGLKFVGFSEVDKHWFKFPINLPDQSEISPLCGQFPLCEKVDIILKR